jgi:carbamoyl-phosphate synthase large subunit
MNVLLTSVGRRNYLIDYFKEAVEPYGGKVFAVNSHENAPALYVADEFRLAPPINSEDYISFLLNFCLEKKIELIVPLLDNDLPVLAQAKRQFSEVGVYVLVADLNLAKLANDKFLTSLFLKQEGFETVGNYCDFDSFLYAKESGEIDFPVIIKPRWGMASLSVYLAKNEEELNFYFKKAKEEVLNSFLKFESKQDPGKEILIMDKIEGEEYMLDVINDLDGNYQLTVVNKKLLRKAGETEAVETIRHEGLEQLGKKISAYFRHPLVMDIDVIISKTRMYIIEFNPRFSGGYPFSHAAGIHLPKALIRWLKKETFDSSEFLTPRVGTRSMKGYVMIEARKFTD